MKTIQTEPPVGTRRQVFVGDKGNHISQVFVVARGRGIYIVHGDYMTWIDATFNEDAKDEVRFPV